MVSTGLALAACTSEPPADTPESRRAPVAATAQPELDAAVALDVPNARGPMPYLVTAGQLTPEQMDGLADAGFQHFISLRTTAEDGAGWEEEHAATADLDFHRLPVAGADGLTRENAEALDHLLEATGGEPTVLYCGSGNRAGALLALQAHWIDGASPEAAFELGQQAGMTGLSEPVRELLGL
jgi:uncharacterized protein (TIGR01244 family)